MIHARIVYMNYTHVKKSDENYYKGNIYLVISNKRFLTLSKVVRFELLTV